MISDRDRMLNYLKIKPQSCRRISNSSIIWAYCSKKVKEKLGEATTWETDQELFDLYLEVTSDHQSERIGLELFSSIDSQERAGSIGNDLGSELEELFKSTDRE